MLSFELPVKPANYYQVGATAMMACQYDRRFSYCLYVPATCDWSGKRLARLMVVVHGSQRMAQQERDVFIDLADRHGLIILAPLFPMGVGHSDDTEGYKLIRHHGIHYDDVLFAMIDEVARRYPVATEQFFLHGFSGGGQFAHRFYYLHPERLWAVSIGAPGSVTLIDENKPWWVGTGDLEKACGRPINLAAMRRVSVRLVIGDRDTEPGEVKLMDGSERWMPGIDAAGSNRQERLKTLHDNLRCHEISAALTLVPDVAHNALRAVEPVKKHFSQFIEQLPSL